MRAFNLHTLLYCLVCSSTLYAFETEQTSGTSKSPAELKIELAQNAIRRFPDRPDGHNALALALTRRARETSDPSYYELASHEITLSLQIEPDNFDARRLEIWIALGQHEFSRALPLARALSKSRPDDILAYALLTDACIETGHYDEAEKAAQWALDMRPGDIAALTRAAYLRELFGDIQGSIDLMQSAYLKTPESEYEDRAWILTQFAHLQLMNGKPEVAKNALLEALRLFPKYHYSLGNLVKVHVAQNRYEDAVVAAKAFCASAPHPENLFVLAETLAKAKKHSESQAAFVDFEARALAESNGPDNANRELVFYYTDYANQPEKALKLAKIEMERRQDVFTREAYAWALQADGQYEKADHEIHKVLEVGIRDPAILYRAGLIAARNGQMEIARTRFQESLKQADQSSVCHLARNALAEISSTKE